MREGLTYSTAAAGDQNLKNNTPRARGTINLLFVHQPMHTDTQEKPKSPEARFAPELQAALIGKNPSEL